MKPPLRESMTGIVLAGGKSSRMGFNKAFIQLKEKRFIDHTVEVLKELFDEVIVVVKDVRAYSYLDARVVKDILDDQCSLVGLYTGLLSTTREYSFVTACDMPFLKKEVIHYLASLREGYDAVIPIHDGYYEPLHGVYSRRCLKVLEERIREGDYRIKALFRTLRIRGVEGKELRALDPELTSFVNINTREDLKRLKELVG